MVPVTIAANHIKLVRFEYDRDDPETDRCFAAQELAFDNSSRPIADRIRRRSTCSAAEFDLVLLAFLAFAVFEVFPGGFQRSFRSPCLSSISTKMSAFLRLSFSR